MKTILLPLLFTALLSSTLAGPQSVRVLGKFLCHGKPEQFADLKLVDYGLFGSTDVDKDKFTDPSGFFELAGTVDSWFNFDAWVYVWHKCYPKEYEHKDPCWKHITIKVPKVQIQQSQLPDRTWNMGEFPLDLAKNTDDWCP